MIRKRSCPVRRGAVEKVLMLQGINNSLAAYSTSRTVLGGAKAEMPWSTHHTSNVRNIIKTHNAKTCYTPKGVYLPNDSTLTPEDFYDTNIYRKRHIIERLFGRLKENKRIAMRFDKLDSTFFSFIALALTKLFKLFC